MTAVARLGWKPGPLGVFSRGVLRIAHLEEFLTGWGTPVPALHAGKLRDDLVAIVGWGHRDTADGARAAAGRAGLPYLALEDGFLRSVGLGNGGVQPLGLVIDDLGIYYDAASPSRLETLIAKPRTINPDVLALLDQIRRHGLTKYNIPAKASQDETGHVYVLDQTVGDTSVYGGAGDHATFEAMLDSAVEENVGTRVVLRAHPVVVAGHRQGYLMDYAARQGVEVDISGRNWITLARNARRVYTVSSLGGFEALIAGAPVTCFGIPFYSNWGLTDDRQPCRRRTARPSIEQVFAAAYWDYSRYVDPTVGKACDGLVAATRLAEQHAGQRRNEIVARIATAFRR